MNMRLSAFKYEKIEVVSTIFFLNALLRQTSRKYLGELSYYILTVSYFTQTINL